MTRDGVAVTRTLDARPDRLDLRDREFAPQVRSLPRCWPDDTELAQVLPAYAGAGLVRDQGADGACTGFGLACVVNFLLFRRELAMSSHARVESVSPRMLYHLARFYDEWPGEAYEGSSCRGALKAWHKHGVCSEQLWPYTPESVRGRKTRVQRPLDGWDVDALTRTLGVYYRVNHESVVDMQAAILQVGAIYVSAEVHDGWNLRAVRQQDIAHAALPRIAPITSQKSLGGHAFALIGYNQQGFVVQNSWGTSWGQSGFAVLPYAEWVQYGSDAWVCSLGVPADTERVLRDAASTRSSHVRVYGESPGVALPEASVSLRAARSEPPPVSAAVRPWSSEQALLHTLVFGNDGRVINRVVTHQDAADSVQQLVIEAPQRWFSAHRGAHRLLIYAHGGMTSEHDSVRRIQVLAPYFHANGIYPLFLTWKTGPLETLGDILADQLRRVPRPDGGVWDRFREIGAKVLDRTLEVVAGPVVKPIWTQMKQNAAMATERGMGLDLLARALTRLNTRVPRLQIHFAAHSAGAILLGYLLTRLGRGSLRVKSCSLYAPSCTVAFALEHYARAFNTRRLAMRHTHLHVLSERRELEDSVGPYRKSVLYLISRALEASHKTAVLGLQSASAAPLTPILWHHDQLELVRRWQALWGADNPNLHVLDAPQVSTGRFGHPLRTAHTCFDNAAPIIDATLARILDQPPRYPVEWLGY